jgi:copper resistance protein C
MNARLSILGGFVAISVMLAAPAWAHSFPEQESPTAGETLAAPPSTISIKYDAQIEHLFATLEVLDSTGKNVAGNPVVSDDGYTLSVKVDGIKPGDYTVKWGVVCVDTHHTQGSYSFTVTGASS